MNATTHQPDGGQSASLAASPALISYSFLDGEGRTVQHCKSRADMLDLLNSMEDSLVVVNASAPPHGPEWINARAALINHMDAIRVALGTYAGKAYKDTHGFIRKFRFVGACRQVCVSTGGVVSDDSTGVNLAFRWSSTLDGMRVPPSSVEVYSDDEAEYADMGLEWEVEDGALALSGYDGVADLPLEVAAALLFMGYKLGEFVVDPKDEVETRKLMLSLIEVPSALEPAPRVEEKQTPRMRRLTREHAYVVQQIEETEEHLKYNPYEEDRPGLERYMAELQEDLAAIKSEMTA
jgi:hypothetical protein